MANTLVVRLAEDAWNGDAQFTLMVDGVQIAGPTSVTTAEGSGYQEFSYSGDYGAGPHTVAVNFINDGWGGSAATDRNLYVNGIVFDGTFYAGQTAANNASNGGPDVDPNAAEMNVNGTTTFTNVVNGSSPPPPPPPPGSDTLVLHLSEDAWNGDAQFAVFLDGAKLAGPVSVTTAHGTGWQDFTYTGAFGAGPHTVEVQFLNDAYGGTPSTDRNLYVQGITFDGATYSAQNAPDTGAGADTDPSAAEVLSNGTVTFSNVTGSSGGGGGGGTTPPPAGPGSDTLVVYVSAWNNPFKIVEGMTVTVDGKAVAALNPPHATSSHGDIPLVGDSAITFTGDFGPGPHTVDLHFNDYYVDGAGLEDDGFTLSGIDFNGQHFNVDAAENHASGSSTDPRAITGKTGDVIFRNIPEGTSAPNVTLNQHINMFGGPGDDLLIGAGNVSNITEGLWGGAGRDTFVVIAGFGDKSLHFQAGAGGDVVDLVGYGYTSFADVMAHMTSGSQLINPNGETIHFYNDSTAPGSGNPTPSTFTADNFILDGATSSVADMLVLHVSEDAWNGDAEFAVRVDGKQVGTVMTTTASHAQGQVQHIPLVGHFGAGPHTVEVQFLNDAWGGTATTDRNLYVQSITYNAVTYSAQNAPDTGAGADTDPNAAEMMSNGTVTFANVGGASSGGGGTPAVNDTLVVYLSADFFAQFTVLIDGKALNNLATAAVQHDAATGQYEALTFTAAFGAGPHTVQVNFNDPFGSGSPPSALYVYGIDFNGTHYSGQTAANDARGTGGDVDPNAAEMNQSGTVTFSNVTGGTATGSVLLTGTSGDDLLVGGAGNDTLNGGAGNDSLAGGNGNDVLDPGAGPSIPPGQSMSGGAGSDTYVIHPGEGSPSVSFTAGTGGDVLRLDTLPYASVAEARAALVQHMSEVLLPLSGFDVLHLGGVNDFQNPTLVSSFTDDNFVITNGFHPAGGTFSGGSTSDNMVGTDGADTISGNGGNDTINGGMGNDSILGGDGNDVLQGWFGNDTLDGGPGDDTLNGGAGQDVLIGGAGNDRFTGSIGDDTMTGGAGSDTYFFFSPLGQDQSQTGNPTITDFQTGPGGDVAGFGEYGIASPPGTGGGLFILDAFYDHMTDFAAGTRLTAGPGVFTFLGVSRDDFTPDNLSLSELFLPTGTNGTGGPDTLVVHASEDAWNGDATFRLRIDGHEVSGPVHVTQAHSSGGWQDITFTGTFGTNAHTVDIEFVNDAWGGTADTDRNLYVRGITYNGHDFSGQTAANTGAGPDVDPTAAEMFSNGVLTFHDVIG